MKKNIHLSEIIMNSFFITIAIACDLLSKSFVFLKMSFFFAGVMGKIFKISFLILLCSGFLLGFRNGFLVCLSYSFFHLIKSIPFLIEMKKVLLWSDLKLLSSCILDYILPNLIISLSGFLYSSKKNNIIMKKNIIRILLIICCSRMLFYFLSGYYIYFSCYPQYKDHFFWFCLIYSFFPCFLSFFISIIFLFFLLKSKIKTLFEFE
ncbi:hypothetical protein [Candidatus Phytoplasma pini]|uniref:Putative thiamine transporter protein, ThiA/YuaJ family n=1 Tax=Candidatus Phytoplasma pini TaxID=267362 RepID=A0A559KJW2_9MOLU|nr:hypothetical protein [Candidatus Phytoplasma pini]TVY12397.1 putative thiamine transporter protein, ThiA/YuaJ family [Candidatus Phytoplasma pini]